MIVTIVMITTVTIAIIIVIKIVVLNVVLKWGNFIVLISYFCH